MRGHKDIIKDMPTIVEFNSTASERKIINKIVDRAYAEIPRIDRLSLNMDLDAVRSNGCALDFEKLFEFDDFNFAHDVCGIIGHMDRVTGKLLYNFLPRCAK